MRCLVEDVSSSRGENRTEGRMDGSNAAAFHRQREEGSSPDSRLEATGGHAEGVPSPARPGHKLGGWREGGREARNCSGSKPVRQDRALLCQHGLLSLPHPHKHLQTASVAQPEGNGGGGRGNFFLSSPLPPQASFKLNLCLCDEMPLCV